MNRELKAEINAVLSDVINDKGNLPEAKEKARKCWLKLELEQTEPKYEDMSTKGLTISDVLPEMQVKISPKAVDVKIDNWRCPYCSQINTVTNFALDLVNDNRLIVSTCKGCSSRYQLKKF